MNVEVEMVSADSVRVSWDSSDFPGKTGYMVYYNPTANGTTDIIEASLHVTNSTNSVVIENLLSNAEYQFQVAASIAELDGSMTIGHRSALLKLTLPELSTEMAINSRGEATYT